MHDNIYIDNFLKIKSIFDHPTIIRVRFWPSNFKTGYSWPSNYQNRLYLVIWLFWRVVLLMWMTHGGGAHMSASFSLLFPLCLPFSALALSAADSSSSAGGDKLTYGPHYHVSSTSTKLSFKTAKWSNINSFDSLIVKNTQFWSLMAKIELRW